MDYMKILVLEEDESKRLMLGLYLKDQGIDQELTYITAPQLTSELLQSEIYDLLILDLNNLDYGIGEMVLKINNSIETPIIMAEEVVDLEKYKDVNMDRVYIVNDVLNFQSIHKLVTELINPTINLTYLSEIAEVAMPEPEVLINKLAQSFYELAPNKISQIEDFLKDGDFKAVSKTAHALRSTCYNVGAYNFAATLKILEESTRIGKIKNDKKFWNLLLKHELEKASKSLQNIINNKLYLTR
jgi:HPt (histidine-containing phosphotransfer) domain-containing protein